jgi:hypothetical protein
VSVPVPVAPPDAVVLGRVQQENQRQILGKLLHDLRNPVHSIRISMELFGRLARRSGDLDKMMERAAAYIDPAEGALENLLVSSDRLGRYLSAPAAAEIAPLPLSEVLAEISMLARGSKRRLQVTLPESDPMLKIYADRVRLSHLLLHRCVNNAAANVAISTRVGADNLLCIDLHPASAADDGVHSPPLGAAELQSIVETAGGTLAGHTEAGALSICFRRWLALPQHG